MRWWLVFGILLVAVSVRAARLEIGPYLQQPSHDGTIVVFETDAHTAAEVLVETEQGVRRFPSAAGRHHEVRVSGLRPGRYHYHVAIGEVLSPIAELTTATTGQTFSFLVYGDNRDGHANHAHVVAAMSTHHPDFLINTGDMTSDGDVEPLWRRFFEIELPLLSSVPLYPALGNHEVKNDRQASHFHRFFVLPGSPSIAAHERYYSFRYGNALFIALDSNESAHREQARWLRRTLDAARGDPAIHHRFVYFHHPPFSVGSECGSAIEQGLWVPLFEQYQVTAVFVGHEHAYERLIVMSTCRCPQRNGPGFVTVHESGSPLGVSASICGVLSVAPSDVEHEAQPIIRREKGRRGAWRPSLPQPFMTATDSPALGCAATEPTHCVRQLHHRHSGPTSPKLGAGVRPEAQGGRLPNPMAVAGWPAPRPEI